MRLYVQHRIQRKSPFKGKLKVNCILEIELFTLHASEQQRVCIVS